MSSKTVPIDKLLVKKKICAFVSSEIFFSLCTAFRQIKILVEQNPEMEFLKIPKLGNAGLIRDQRYLTDPDAEMPRCRNADASGNFLDAEAQL